MHEKKYICLPTTTNKKYSRVIVLSAIAKCHSGTKIEISKYVWEIENKVTSTQTTSDGKRSMFWGVSRNMSPSLSKADFWRYFTSPAVSSSAYLFSDTFDLLLRYLYTKLSFSTPLHYSVYQAQTCLLSYYIDLFWSSVWQIFLFIKSWCNRYLIAQNDVACMPAQKSIYLSKAV